ncbi:DNA-binding protein [Erwinia psidii]|uniref:BRO-N domain-containing protein n=1 Tax=Erwinia psidii TaxID=69224 RepID=UPI00226B48BF|nr:BRO family protein [Erwinia psidii]MCX8967402.1 DNA-binding protein [Erwinia psidii]
MNKNKLMKFESPSLGVSLSGSLYQGKPVFDAVEVAKSLGYKNPSDALKKHCKSLIKLNYSESRESGFGDNPRGIQLAPEADLYRLILRSQLESAERVQDWVCEDVLPSIRQTGAYGVTNSQPELSRLEILQIAMESETGRIAEKQRADKAERTKGQISRKREASALGKLSAATRRCRELEERLGESTKDATITKVEKATGRKDEFKFVALRRWCKENKQSARDVADERWGSVKSWPAAAWLAVYGIELKTLFRSAK